MSTNERCKKWVSSTIKEISIEFNLQYEMIQNRHFKITFKNSNNISCIIVIPSTPSTKYSRIQTITEIRRNLRSKYGNNLNSSFFTMQYLGQITF